MCVDRLIRVGGMFEAKVEKNRSMAYFSYIFFVARVIFYLFRGKILENPTSCSFEQGRQICRRSLVLLKKKCYFCPRKSL